MIRPGRRALPLPTVILGLILVAILMVWAWRRAPAPADPGIASWAWPVAGGSATLAFLWLGYEERRPRDLDPMFRFYPPFREYYAGWRAFDTYMRAAGCPRGLCRDQYPLLSPGTGVAQRGPLHQHRRASRLADARLPPRGDGARTGYLAEFPAGLGSAPARRTGLAGQPRCRGNPAPGRHPGQSRRGPAQQGRCRGVPRSSGDGPTLIPNDSSCCTARKDATHGSGCTGSSARGASS